MQRDPAGFASPDAHDVHRLFFALWPDDATRGCIADAAARLKAGHAPAGRWIGAHRYHLTLQFLGQFPDGCRARLLPSLVDAARAAAATVQAPAFALTLDRVGSFRNRAIPWWLGCDPEHQQLQQLWDGLGRALANRGIQVPAAALTPHVTVLRGADRPLAVTGMTPSVAWPVTSFVLIHSELGTRNAYTVVGQWPLGLNRPGH